jgi:hypothetical protein
MEVDPIWPRERLPAGRPSGGRTGNRGQSSATRDSAKQNGCEFRRPERYPRFTWRLVTPRPWTRRARPRCGSARPPRSTPAYRRAWRRRPGARPVPSTLGRTPSRIAGRAGPAAGHEGRPATVRPVRCQRFLAERSRHQVQRSGVVTAVSSVRRLVWKMNCSSSIVCAAGPWTGRTRRRDYARRRLPVSSRADEGSGRGDGGRLSGSGVAYGRHCGQAGPGERGDAGGCGTVHTQAQRSGQG